MHDSGKCLVRMFGLTVYRTDTNVRVYRGGESSRNRQPLLVNADFEFESLVTTVLDRVESLHRVLCWKPPLKADKGRVRMVTSVSVPLCILRASQKSTASLFAVFPGI
jgi:hypothetical protein